MTIYKARKVSFAYYLAAAALLFVCLLTEVGGILKYVFYGAMVLLAMQGYRTATKCSRCPKCGHVLQVGLYKITQCSLCRYPITDQTMYTF